jgi:hypothetical protein
VGGMIVRCVICGHRSFKQKRQTDAWLREEMLWDKILAFYDRRKPHVVRIRRTGIAMVITI